MTVIFPVGTREQTAAPELVRESENPALPAVAVILGLMARVLRASVAWDIATLLVLTPFALQTRFLGGHALALGVAVLVPCWLFLLTAVGAYETRGRRAAAQLTAKKVRRVVQAGVGFAAVLPVTLSATGLPVAPARDLATAALASAAALLHRSLADLVSRRAASGAGTGARIVVSGHGHAVDRVLAELTTGPDSVLEVVRVCAAQSDAEVDLLSVAQRVGADAVVVVPCKHHDPLSLRRLGWRLERTGVRLLVATGLHDVSRARASVEFVGRLPLVQVRPPALDSWRMRLKSVTDRALGGVALAVLAPVMVVVALMIRTESPGPALFRQTRVGKDGTFFTMLKFRTMREGSELEHDRLSALDTSSVLFKIRADPRVTRVGRLLRRYSLDELPQLFNVARGDMSLVGPRPALPCEVEQYEPDTRRRLAVRPGITGLWQVSGRSDLCWEETVRLDLRYVDNWSLGADLRIVGRTFGAVLSHRGAY